MRRLTMALAALSAAGTLAITLPGSAFAADGVLFINGRRFIDPSGCINVPSLDGVRILNGTNEAAFVFEGINCMGDVIAAVEQGDAAFVEAGASVFIR
ncbi:hypothetical protein ABZ297_10005 [Nonomuraea sp. NPDC005983]|uniref:hypothetical protein n=1 Tax=Nonomuraea sp. NPDC005983 TaxID=3155595 RepID=UPI0033BBF849